MVTRVKESPVESVGNFAIPKGSERSFTRQFANIYWLRLVTLREPVLLEARKKWGKLEPAPKHVPRVLDINTGELCFIVGTVYVDMAGKPNVLEDLQKELFISKAEEKPKYWSESDEIMMEDESGRVRLVGDRISNHAGTFVTGTIVAALGIETPAGDFEVVDVCHTGRPNTKEETTKTFPEEWIAFASGLNIKGKGTDEYMPDFRLGLLEEWLLGEVENPLGANISRLVICGNSITPTMTSEEERRRTYVKNNAQSNYSNLPKDTFDALLSSLAGSMSIDVLPGENDPCPPLLPQPPLPRALFPRTGLENAAVSFRTNPYEWSMGGRVILSTSGQALDDVYRYLKTEDRLEAARNTLEWSHMAPTAPDTLSCYPFTDRDPFMMTSRPDVYVIGNQPAFQTELVDDKTRIVLVPAFSETGAIVLVNLKTLEPRLVTLQ